jgi:bifunctional ADP-heptose synthase (sugar kinase/adenylyltransferase)
VFGDTYGPGGVEDAALAVLAAGLGAGLSLVATANLAVLAASIAGAKGGTAIASAGELSAALASAAQLQEPGSALRVEMPPQARRGRQSKAQG